MTRDLNDFTKLKYSIEKQTNKQKKIIIAQQSQPVLSKHLRVTVTSSTVGALAALLVAN